MNAIGKGSRGRETFFRTSYGRACAVQFGEACQIDVTAGDDGDDFAGAGAAAERRGDRACRPRLRRRRARARRSCASPRATSSSDTTIDSSTSVLSSGHIVGSTDLPPAPSTNDGCPVRRSSSASPRASEVASGAAVSGSAAKIAHRRLQRAHDGADARQQPAAAERRDDRIDIRQVFENLQARRPIAGDEAIVVERMHEVAVHARRAVRLDRLPAFVVDRP